MPLTGPGGSDPVAYMRAIELAALPTEGDLLYALGRQALRIQERTAAGIDYSGQAFAPYSIHGPYYHNPAGAGVRSLKGRQAAALHHSRYYGGARRRGSTTVRYESYAAYKASIGAGVVDLGGMEGSLLPAIRVRVGDEFEPEAAAHIGLDAQPALTRTGAIGIYNENEAKIAEGHNSGIPGRLPQRMFIGISDEDLVMITADLTERAEARLAIALQGKG